MNSTRRDRKSKPQQATQPGWGVMILVALFLCRLLVPTEATEQGHTLWLCSCTFAFAAFFFFLNFRNQTTHSLRPRLTDLAVGLMVLGHLISGIYILSGAGNQRSALNMIWEWLAIGQFWILLRTLLPQKYFREYTAFTIIVTVLGLSLLGLWQHYVWYPQQSAKFVKLVDYNDRSRENENLSTSEQDEFKELLNEFGTDILTLDMAGRMSFLARVKESVEPIGLFVLANTFALILLVPFLIVLFNFYDRITQFNFPQKFAISLTGCLILLCLILTKSRTAWVGVIGGVVFYLLSQWILKGSQIRIRNKYLFIALGLLIGLIIWTTSTGGLDRQVISEAPKSLQYRLEYWYSTIQLLQERPLLGAGPGNFRQSYVQYKLPGSSEEILDPHNLFLGIWSGGGMIALTGLCLLLLSALSSGIQNAQVKFHQQNNTQSSTGNLKSLAAPIIFAYTLTIAVSFVLEGYVDARLILMGLLSCGLSILIFGLKIQFCISPGYAFAAFVAAIIHLLGASGIEMPAVVMMLLLLTHFSDQIENLNEKAFALGRTGNAVAMLMSGGFLVACLVTGLLPVQLSNTNINIGKSMLLIQGNPQLAKRYFQSAVDADSLSPEPLQQLAMLHFSNWKSSGGRDQNEFALAIQHLEEAIQLDPVAAGRYRTLGNFWDSQAEFTQDKNDALRAVKAFEGAVSLYPNFAEIQAELAVAQQRAKLHAHVAAQKAIQLDQLNHKLGHTDKFLPEELRNRLEKIVANDSHQQHSM